MNELVEFDTTVDHAFDRVASNVLLDFPDPLIEKSVGAHDEGAVCVDHLPRGTPATLVTAHTEVLVSAALTVQNVVATRTLDLRVEF